MLNCKQITERASDFIDATLPWHARLQVRLHLMMCRFCREYVRQLSLVTRTLRVLPREQPSLETEGELLSLFRAERHQPRGRCTPIMNTQRFGLLSSSILDAVLAVAFFSCANRLVMAPRLNIEPGLESTGRADLAR